MVYPLTSLIVVYDMYLVFVYRLFPDGKRHVYHESSLCLLKVNTLHMPCISLQYLVVIFRIHGTQ